MRRCHNSVLAPCCPSHASPQCFALTCSVWWQYTGTGPTDLGGEDGLVVQLLLDPRHEVVDVLRSRALDGLLHCGAVRPVVLVPMATEGLKLSSPLFQCSIFKIAEGCTCDEVYTQYVHTCTFWEFTHNYD